MVLFKYKNDDGSKLIHLFIALFAVFFLGKAHGKEEVHQNQHIAYNTQAQHLDLYLPAQRDKNAAIMFLHGGGFDGGDKFEMTEHARHFAKQGFVTASINFRLSLSAKHPAAITDATDALNWMKKNAPTYGYDPDKIILVGYSTGGTIALNVGLESKNGVAAIVDIAGITNIDKYIRNEADQEVTLAMNKYLDGQDISTASPITQVNKNAPPTLVFHGKNDGVVSIWHSISLVEKLEAYKVPATFKVIHNADHNIMLSENQHYNQLLTEISKFVMQIELD
jgi:acetyl esterase/lipase